MAVPPNDVLDLLGPDPAANSFPLDPLPAPPEPLPLLPPAPSTASAATQPAVPPTPAPQPAPVVRRRVQPAAPPVPPAAPPNPPQPAPAVQPPAIPPTLGRMRSWATPITVLVIGLVIAAAIFFKKTPTASAKVDGKDAVKTEVKTEATKTEAAEPKAEVPPDKAVEDSAPPASKPVEKKKVPKRSASLPPETAPAEYDGVRAAYVDPTYTGYSTGYPAGRMASGSAPVSAPVPVSERRGDVARPEEGRRLEEEGIVKHMFDMSRSIEDRRNAAVELGKYRYYRVARALSFMLARTVHEGGSTAYLINVRESPVIRAAAATSMGDIANSSFLPLLRNSAAKDPDPIVRQAANEAVAKISARVEEGADF